MINKPVYRPHWHILVYSLLLWAVIITAVYYGAGPCYHAIDKELTMRPRR